ncbi:MAG: hypothetical protein IJL50_07335 [Bacteroidaceae bacterium]|nr:hypothetical protein [Bacteroidaceae bacterium]
MKKTYIAPELFAVAFQHQDNVLVQTSFVYSGENGGVADVKAFDFVDDDEDAGTTTASPRNIWDEEW